MRIGGVEIGNGAPCFVVAEIGINHNGDLDIARKLIDVAAAAGCEGVKFQKRDPLTQVSPDKRDVMRCTPWGEMTTLAYRQRMEFGLLEYRDIARHCQSRGIQWFVSVWDLPSLAWMLEHFHETPAIKIPSLLVHRQDIALLDAAVATGKPLLVSTGMCNGVDVSTVLPRLDPSNTCLMQCTSSYPCPDEDLSLPVIEKMRSTGCAAIGYSGHESGLLPTIVAAIVYRVDVVERHITLDRGMRGSDHGASLEPVGLTRLVRDIRRAERLMSGSIFKEIQPSERPHISRLGGIAK